MNSNRFYRNGEPINLMCRDGEIIYQNFGHTEIPDIPANNQILYTTSNGKKIEPTGMTTVLNIYRDGKGLMVFADDLTAITENSFSGSTALTSIHFPQSIKQVGDRCCRDCFNLTSVTMYEGITGIGVYCFANTNLVDFGWPASVTGVGGDSYGLLWASGNTWSADTLTHTMRINARTMNGYCCWGNFRLNTIIFSENVTGGSYGQYFYTGTYSAVYATGLTDIWFEHRTSLPSGSDFWNAFGNTSYIPTTGTLHLVQGVDESNLTGRLANWTKVYYTI